MKFMFFDFRWNFKKKILGMVGISMIRFWIIVLSIFCDVLIWLKNSLIGCKIVNK